MALDWVLGKMGDIFDLVLLFEVRQIHEETFVESVMSHLLPLDSRLEKPEVEDILRDPENQRRTLVILDGFEEYGEPENCWVNHLLQNRILRHSSVLITSRSPASSSLITMATDKYSIRGMDASSRSKFLDVFAMECDCSRDEYAPLEADTFALKDLTCNPLFLMLMSLLLEDSEGNLPNTRTGLVKAVSDVALQHCQDDTDALREVAYQGVHTNKYSFTESEIRVLLAQHNIEPENLKHCGLLVARKSGSVLRPCVKYAFIQKTFQEYLAAEYVCDRGTDTMIALAKDLSEEEQVLRFMAGILSERRPERLQSFLRMCICCDKEDLCQSSGKGEWSVAKSNSLLEQCLEECGNSVDIESL